jgi:hypothetical protein
MREVGTRSSRDSQVGEGAEGVSPRATVAHVRLAQVDLINRHSPVPIREATEVRHQSHHTMKALNPRYEGSLNLHYLLGLSDVI